MSSDRGPADSSRVRAGASGRPAPSSMEPPPGAPGEPAPWGQEPFAGQEPEELDGAAAGVMDRILLESVCQQQGWARVYAWVKKLKNLKWTRTVTDIAGHALRSRGGSCTKTAHCLVNLMIRRQIFLIKRGD